MYKGYTSEQRIRIAKELGIIVDEQDMWLISQYTWHVNDGYVRTHIAYQGVLLHHMIMGVPWYEDEQIDHINRDKLDNRRSNLRYANRFQQQQNNDWSLDAKHILKVRNRYRLAITRNGEAYIKSFATYEEAVAARAAWLQQLDNKERSS